MTDDAGDSRDAEAVFAEWLARVEAGEPLDFEELARAHAEVEVELRQLHDDWRTFAPVLGKVVPGMMSSIQGDGVPLDADAPGDEPHADELLARFGVRVPHGDRYRFRRVIAEGGQGVVLKVWDSKLRRPLAMKIVLGRDETRPSGDTPKVDRGMLARFVDEARIASQLNHPGIVPVHEIGADDTGRAFFTMKLVKGDDLSVIFERVRTGENGWSEVRALDTLMRVCETIAYAHSKGVIHRDLKPANVMVGPFGEVHVMDWGLARVAGEPDRRDLRIREASVVDSLRKTERDATPRSPIVTVDGTTIGTPCYMPPEQAKGQLELIGPHSDVYSVGAMLYELIAGERPYVPRDARVPMAVVLENVMHGPPRELLELAPRAPAELIAICEQAMARAIKDRYASMSALADDLRAFINGRVVSAYETGTWAETKKWVKRNRALAASLAAVVVVLATGMTATLVLKAQSDQNAREAEENTYYAAVIGAQAARRASGPANVRRLLDSAPERLRNWEWRFLDSAADTSLLIVGGREHAVRAASFSPDGTRIVTASADHTVRVWDATTGEAMSRMEGHAERVISAAFSPDGTRIVSCSSFVIVDDWRGIDTRGDNTARVWDAMTGRELATLDGHTESVRGATFSPNSACVVTWSEDGTARLWEAANGRELAKLEGHVERVNSATFNTDGSRLVTASDDCTARVWDTASGMEVVKLEGHTSEVNSAIFNSVGSRVVTASNDDTARVWDAASGRELAKLEGHVKAVNSAMFTSDGSRVVTASDDCTARVWDTASGMEVAKLEGHTSQVNSAAFNSVGSCVVTASNDDTARVWDAASGRGLAELKGHVKAVNSAKFSSDGSRVITASDDYTARVWDAHTGENDGTLNGLKHGARAAAFSPDGARILVWTDGNYPGLWDAASGRELARLEGHTDSVCSAAFSPDGARIVTASSDKTARVWDATTGRGLATLEGHTERLRSVAFSPDGLRIVTASADWTGRLWDADDGHELATLEGHRSTVDFAAFSPDGARVVTASADNTACVWDAASGKALTQLIGHTWPIWSVAFSPDGSRIVTASQDTSARIWDAVSGQELRRLTTGTANWSSGVTHACFSPDGTRLLTASMVDNACVWSVVSGQKLCELWGSAHWAINAAWSSDGQRIVTSPAVAMPFGSFQKNDDNSARVWDASSGEELLRLEGHASPVIFFAFSPDGARVLTVSTNDTVRLWDSVPYRERFAERRAVEAAREAGEVQVAEAMACSTDFADVGALLSNDASLDPFVRRAALDRLLERSSAAQECAHALERKRPERLWVARLLGHQAWPSEQQVERELGTGADVPVDPDELNVRARQIVDPSAPEHGNEVLALIFARRAMALDPQPVHRTTLARALYRRGRFDEALVEQRKALDQASEDAKAEFQSDLDRLQTDIAALRDESGELRRAELTAKLEALDKEIAALEADPDVRMWLGGR